MRDLWISPVTGCDTSRCPWLRKLPGREKYKCRIHDHRPDACRGYPVDVEQMVLDGCEMLESGDLDCPLVELEVDLEELRNPGDKKMKTLKIVVTREIEIPDDWEITFPSENEGGHVKIGEKYYLPDIQWMELEECSETRSGWAPADEGFDEEMFDRIREAYHEISIGKPGRGKKNRTLLSLL